MRVLIVNSLYYPERFGGAEVSVQLLAESLVEQGHEVSVACLSRGKLSKFESLNGVHVFRIKLFNIYWPFDTKKRNPLLRLLWHTLEIFNPIMIFRLKKVIDEVRPEVVHTNNIHGFSTGIWSVASRRGIPVVHTIRDYALLCSRGSLYRNGERCLNGCTDCRALCLGKKSETRHVQTVVGISRHILDEHISRDMFGRRHEAAVVFNGVRELPGHAELDATGGCGEKVVFGFIGRLVEEKGVMQLIRAFNQLRDSDDQVRLIIAGSGGEEYVASLKQAAGKGIDIIGQIDARHFYGNIDIAVVPSLWDEPFGRTVAEALVEGCAVICSNRGGLPELVAGRAFCKVFDPDCEGALFDALQYARQHWDKGARRSRAARERSGIEFNPSVIATQYENLYQESIKSAIPARNKV